MAFHGKNSKYYRDKVAEVRQRMQESIMNEFKEEKKKKIDPYNKEIFNKGMEWYYTGLAIADADEKIRDNTNFIRGFELAVRQDKIKQEMESLGANWFYSGNALEDASSYYLNNQFFVNGYNDAKNKKKLGR